MSKQTMSFEEFLICPRNSELLDGLRTLPKRPKSEAELKTRADVDAAQGALFSAGLSWLVDQPHQAFYLSKSKRKLWDRYNQAWDAYSKVNKAEHIERQRFIYDRAVEAGILAGKEDK